MGSTLGLRLTATRVAGSSDEAEPELLPKPKVVTPAELLLLLLLPKPMEVAPPLAPFSLSLITDFEASALAMMEASRSFGDEELPKGEGEEPNGKAEVEEEEDEEEEEDDEDEDEGPACFSSSHLS